MKRKPCLKDDKDSILMTEENLLICLRNQEGYENKQLNDSLHLQYYGFSDIDNLHSFKSLHTLFLNNNAIDVIKNLECLASLTIINLSYNRIRKFEGLKHLVNLHTIDLSNNLIEAISEEEIAPIDKLSQLKIGHNKFTSYESIKAIRSLSKSLTYLDLSSNTDFAYDPLFYSEFLQEMQLITVLSLQNTAFNRSVGSYRKETINAAPALLFLDDRPVTEDEKLLAKAWKQGGLVLEKEVRQKIREKLQDKQTKIYSEMQERTRVAEQKRKRVFDKITCREQSQLNHLVQKVKGEDFELESSSSRDIVNLRIDDLQRYLQLIREQLPQMNLDKILGDGKVEVPMMIIDKETPTTIFVYNVSQEQIPLIKEKYYPNDQREIVAVNYTQQNQLRWIPEYDALLLDCYNQLKGNLDLLASTFNLSLYDYDQNTSRKAKRFELQQLKEHLTKMTAQQDRRQKSIELLYELD